MYNLKHPRENNDGVILGQLDLIQQLFSEPDLATSGITAYRPWENSYERNKTRDFGCGKCCEN